MATYFENWVDIRALDVSTLPDEEAALIDGYKWGEGGYGTGVTLPYSFPQETSTSGYFVRGYGTGPDFELTNWFGLHAGEQSAIVEALNSIAQGANITFIPYDDNELIVGELRFTGSHSTDSYAHAYTPYDEFVESGDVWFSTEWRTDDVSASEKGSFEYMTIIHEIGHAIGLQHSFDDGNFEEVWLPDEYDNYLYTVMSYTAGPDMDESVYADFYPTTLMYLDLVALEQLYGPPLSANPGNTDYVFHSNQRYWQTITDSSGIDTITYVSPTEGGTIDLSNADFSRMGRPVNFDNDTSTRDTIGLGPSTRIENATGGEGSDDLIGNYLANRLIGNGGNDTLTGSAGSDFLSGGTGTDRLLGGNGNDTLVWSAGDEFVGGGGTDRLKRAAGHLNLRLVDNSQISDVEVINLTGVSNNTLTLNASDVLDISSSTNTLKVLGNDGDSVNIVGTFDVGAVTGGFTTYTVGAGRLLIDSDITVS